MDKLAPEVLAALLAAVVAVVWALLKKADNQQQKTIDGHTTELK